MADEAYDDDGGMGDVADVLEDLDEIEEEHLDETIIPEKEIVKESRALQFLTTHHPECRLDSRDEVLNKLPLSHYPPDGRGDSNHKSVPYLTLFEKTKIIGFRANQLAQGARPLVKFPEHMTDVLEIARLELEQKRLPYILKRPMPDGNFEYWRLADLIVI